MHPAAQRVPAWLAESLATLAVTRGERVLVVDALHANVAAQLVRSVGAKGIVVVAARRPAPALLQAADAHPALQVVDIHLTGNADEAFGRFDALFAAPVLPAGDPASRFAHIARAALRPGGRTVLDLPGPGVNDDLSACVGSPELHPGLVGYAADALRDSLAAAGLRDVTVNARTCLEEMADVMMLVDLAATVVGEHADRAALMLAATRILAGRPEPVQSVWRRVRASARR